MRHLLELGGGGTEGDQSVSTYFLMDLSTGVSGGDQDQKGAGEKTGAGGRVKNEGGR